jgi:pyruvate formate lyase activating enzyme
MEEAKFYKKLANQAVSCGLCYQACLIKNNTSGICRVRKNLNGQLFSAVYGYPAAINVDPIEKKPFFHFLPGSLCYSIGTFGCNLKCANCQNWTLSQANNTKKLQTFTSPDKIVAEALESNCQSIAYTYNEPTIFAEYALAIMKLARENNLKNVWVSNGYMSSLCLKTIIPYLDAINVDLKSMDEKFYKVTCRAKLKPILKNLITLEKSGVHLEITTLIIPGLSDDYNMLKSLAEFIANELDTHVPWHLSRFSPEISWKLKKTPETQEETIFTAYDIGKTAGLKYVYAGNLPGDERENTYCPACGELAIRRFGYEIERFDKHGNCANCDKNLDIF